MKRKEYEEFIFESKMEDLRNYYKKNKDLTIIGLNDSQGVNTTTLFRKGLLEFIVDNLEDDEIKTTVINAFSLMFNKTEHINYLLKSNPSLDEIKDLQVYGIVKAIEKAMSDFHMPKFLGKVGYVSKALYKTKAGDKNIKLTDTLKDAKEPIVIYSSGANDLMREGWNNPFSIDKDYKKDNDAYKYALDKLSNKDSIKRVIGRVEENIDNILSINDKTDIFTLGLYIPKSMQNEGMKVFNDAIKMYNEFLQVICDKYHLNYVDTGLNALKNNKSKMNFHVTTRGHNDLAKEVLEQLYYKKLFNNKKNVYSNKEFKIGKNDLYEMLVDLKHDLNAIKMENAKSSREKEIAIEKKEELERQIGVVEKVLMKRM